MALSDRNLMRLYLALAGSVLFHALLLGMQLSATNNSKVGLAASNSLHANLVLAAKPSSYHEGARQDAASKLPNNLTARKRQKPLVAEQQKITPGDKSEEPASKPSMPEPSVEAEKNPAQALGAALQSMARQQYMMMRVQQFFSMARENANGIIKNHFSQDEMAHYQSKHCTLRLVVAPASEQGYEIVQPECDDPNLAAELRAMPWNTTMPLPSEYSLPYQGLIVYLNLSSYDVSIGLDVIVKIKIPASLFCPEQDFCL